ncbi:hypothetical protein EPUL_000346 [Erysiphe pulchra]|uniref:DDE-1 domain-containing protein n=1 Tax=Erysiphe pulchra TaxID=225359 RepID=A0A2S4Q1P2_9PEZI|nr:hypothetical protein EPUL_000346 [Erysiphe pulchra]
MALSLPYSDYFADSDMMGACNIENARLTTDASTPLQPPSNDVKVKHVAIGKGTQNYSCITNNPMDAPAPVGALATLFDASCIAARNPAKLAQLPFEALQTELPTDESKTLTSSKIAVSGHHYFSNPQTPIFDLVTAAANLGSVSPKKADSKPAPPNAIVGKDNMGNGAVPWLKLTATGDIKEVFRVNTAGGSPPKTCQDMPKDFTVQYVADTKIPIKRKAYVKSLNTREWMSIIEAASASGRWLRPAVIFEGQGLQTSCFPPQSLPDWLYTTSEYNWTSNSIGMAWLRQIFIPESATAQIGSGLLVLDGHEIQALAAIDDAAPVKKNLILHAMKRKLFERENNLSHCTGYLFAEAGKAISKPKTEVAEIKAFNARIQAQLDQYRIIKPKKRIQINPNERFNNIEVIKLALNQAEGISSKNNKITSSTILARLENNTVALNYSPTCNQ